MKKLAALIAAVFATASIGVFAQAPAKPAEPAKPAAAAAPAAAPSAKVEAPAKADAKKTTEKPAKKKVHQEEGRAEVRRAQGGCREDRRTEGRRSQGGCREDRRTEGRRAQDRRAQVASPTLRHPARQGASPAFFHFASAPIASRYVPMKIVVGLSGGVDSAVAALLLKRQGHEVVGLFMKNWEDDDDDEHCSTREDLVDAVSVAECVGIEVQAVNFAAQYRERVFASFLAEYRAGRTPNPDVLCNAEIKFRSFLDHAMAMGADRIATGHYARVEEQDGSFLLLKGLDPAKDQSYFLHRLTQAQLAKTVFPWVNSEDRSARDRPRGGPAEPCEEGLDRHLLHR